jgi:fructokinase
MPRIYAIGETILDVIFKGDEPETAKAGGSMLNTAVSLGRLGLPVQLISEYGSDRAGEMIDGFLGKNGIDTSLVHRYSNGKTAISLAFLDEEHNASYSFYKSYPEKRLEMLPPAFHRDDIVLFGAFYSLMPEVRKQLMAFVRAANAAGSLIVYDPNIRSPHSGEIGELRGLIHENISLAGIVRSSDEDFSTMFGITDGQEAYKLVSEHGCPILIYTRSNKGVEVWYPGGKLLLDVPAVRTVSTIGAGDSFNAGLIFECFALKKKPGEMSLKELKMMTETAIRFGSHVCTHYENYITEEFAGKMV